MPEDSKPSPTVERLRETFAPLAAELKPEDQPATTYNPGPDTK